MTNKRKTTPRFKTLKSVNRLIRDHRPNTRAMRNLQGHWSKELDTIVEANDELKQVSWDLIKWSRGHRKLHGRPAKIEDFLRANAERIRQAITQVEATFEAWVAHIQEARRFLDISELVDQQRDNFNQLWLLDLDEDEAHQIQRMKPQPKFERAQPHRFFEVLTDLWGLADDTMGVLPAKAEREPETKSELPALDADGLIASLDEALAGDGLDVEGE